MMEADPLPIKVMAASEPTHTIDLTVQTNLPNEVDEQRRRWVHKRHAKRADIQGLRTVAIFSVLLFHIWPKVFTNGFLGVDMFYVISGYLMAQILSKHHQLNWSRISTFYSRRVHRIVPIYLLITYATLHAGSFLLTSDDFHQLARDGLAALTFTTNFQSIFKGDDYFAELFTYRFFLHTWSLAVEMQFYLLVPFLFNLLLRPRIRSKASWISLVGMALSFALQLSTNEAVSFGLVFCRLWQFFAGIMAFFLAVGGRGALEDEDEEEETDLFSLESEQENKGLLQMEEVGLGEAKKEQGELKVASAENEMLFSRILSLLRYLPNTLLVSLILALITPGLSSLKMEVVQVFVVFSTACLLYLGSFQVNLTMKDLAPMPYLLTNRVSVEIGDASYVWYLIHWPIIEFCLYWSAEGVLTILDGILLLLGTMLLSVVIDKLIDARIRRLTNFKSVLMLIGALYCFCIIFLIPQDLFHQAGKDGTYRQSAIGINTNHFQPTFDPQGDLLMQFSTKKISLSTPAPNSDATSGFVNDTLNSDDTNPLFATTTLISLMRN